MGVISRGIKNAFRNSIRTVSIVFILAVSISMALVMLMALKTVQAKISSVKSSIGNTLTVSPAGIRGFEGGGELLTEQNVSDISSISHVSSVTKTITDRLRQEGTTSNFPGQDDSLNNTTSLVSSIEPGSFGNRQRQAQGESSSSTSSTQTFSMPVSLIGTNNLDSTASLNASKFEITSGEKIDVNSSDNVALIGSGIATKNNLSIGQTFTAYGQTITVAGIFDAGNEFANASVVMPVKAVQALSGQTDQINSIIAQTDSIDSISSVQDAIKTKLGSSVDVTSQQDTSDQAIAPLENIKSISLYSLIGALVAGSIIILLTMIMIVRERRREIGVLKAIGSSNAGIMAQFTVESLILTLTSSVLGIILGLIFSNPVLKVLVNNSEQATKTVDSAVRTGGGMGGIARAIGSNVIPGAQNLVNNLHAVVGYQIILYGLGAAILIAIIGSAIPAFFIAKIRPAEVMRAE
jgi:putative ABC transport system permease protein